MKTPKRPRDTNQLAKFLVDRASGEVAPEQPQSKRAEGGKVGGPARAEALTPDRRREIAKSGAAKRWKKATPTN